MTLEHPSPSRSIAGSGFSVFVALLVLIGVISRAAPLLNQGGRLLRQFPTEDGYLMLTIARNIGLGNGMSTAAGTIRTNGTQPLCTLLWSFCYWLVDGDKTRGIRLIQFLELCISLSAAGMLFCLGSRLLRESGRGVAVAALGAAIWYASPISVTHSMNCLETGAYALAIIIILHSLAAREDEPEEQRWMGPAILMGLLLGIAFWVRNDAVFLVLAVCLATVAMGLPGGVASVRRRFLQATVMGLVSVLIAVPWLIYNKVGFGSIVPISGSAESAQKLAVGLPRLPGTLAEYLLVFLPIPKQMITRRLVIAGSAVIVVLATALLPLFWRRASAGARAVICAVVIYTIALSAFYGLFFGASYFFSRYLFALSPALALLWATVALTAWDWLKNIGVGQLRLAIPAAIVLVIGGLNARLYHDGSHHMHFQVVEWVQKNVPEQAWVGAVQTGTVGYYHDRTINLDGKVNPAALKAMRDARTLEYVVSSRIEYLADWAGIASWAENPALKPYFSLVLVDRPRTPADAATGKHNLAVLRRREVPLISPEVHADH